MSDEYCEHHGVHIDKLPDEYDDCPYCVNFGTKVDDTSDRKLMTDGLEHIPEGKYQCENCGQIKEEPPAEEIKQKGYKGYITLPFCEECVNK